MELETTLTERVIHLALFVAAGLAVAVVALAIVERAVGSDAEAEPPRTIRAVHMAAAIGLVFLVAAAERLYHLL